MTSRQFRSVIVALASTIMACGSQGTRDNLAPFRSALPSGAVLHVYGPEPDVSPPPVPDAWETGDPGHPDGKGGEPDFPDVEDAKELPDRPAPDKPGNGDDDQGDDGDEHFESAVLGKTSGMYAMTVETVDRVNEDLSHVVNPVLAVLEAVDPEMTGAGMVSWQGSASSDPEEHVLVVELLPDTHYEYVMASRAKTGSAAWRTRLGGTYTPGAAQGQGQGAVWADLDMDLDDSTTGVILVLWSNFGQVVELSVFEYAFSADISRRAPSDASFVFAGGPDTPGELAFKGVIDLGPADESGGEASWAEAVVFSRWKPGAGGRVDITAVGKAKGSSKSLSGEMSECWKAKLHETTFESWTVKEKKNGKKTVSKSNGSVKECPYVEPALAFLPQPPPEPMMPGFPLEEK